MSVRTLLFPETSRLLPGHRWLNISLRTLHLIGVSGLGAGFLYPGIDESWRVYWHLTLFSGVLLTLLSVWSNAVWLVQLRGQAILLKLVLLAVIPFQTDTEILLFILAVVISGLIAHAPGSVRYYSLIHGRRIDNL